MAGESAELSADAVIKLFDSLAFMAQHAGEDCSHFANVTLLNFAGEAGGGEGMITDHKEDATVDAVDAVLNGQAQV